MMIPDTWTRTHRRRLNYGVWSFDSYQIGRGGDAFALVLDTPDALATVIRNGGNRSTYAARIDGICIGDLYRSETTAMKALVDHIGAVYPHIRPTTHERAFGIATGDSRPIPGTNLHTVGVVRTSDNPPIMTDADWSLIVWALSKVVWSDKREHDHAMRLIDQIEKARRP